VKHGIDRSTGAEVAVKVIDKSKLTREDEEALMVSLQRAGVDVVKIYL
jgi:hypothetical protein